MSIELNLKNILIAVATTLGLIAAVSTTTFLLRRSELNKNYSEKVDNQARISLCEDE